MNPGFKLLIVLVLSLSLAVLPAVVAAHYAPKPFDYFSYVEDIDLGSGKGYYSGYTEHERVTGQVMMMSVNNDVVSANYSYSYSWSNSSGSTETGSSSGTFTFSSDSFLYLTGTDDQVGYYNPSVWFFMNNDLPVGGIFFFLDTQMTVMDKNYSYYLPSQDNYVSAIMAQGGASYQRNDVYGFFTATYTYKAYYDPNTGYIIGYTYIEQDTDNSGNGFTWSEDLYISASSYPLTIVPNPGGETSEIPTFLIIWVLAMAGMLALFVFAIYKGRKSRDKLPEHSMQQVPPPPLNIDLTSKGQPPVQQIVIKEVAKVRCKYCGALINSTAEVCPICGGPNS